MNGNKNKPRLVVAEPANVDRIAGESKPSSVIEIGSDKHLKQLIAVNVTDEITRIVVRGYVGGILGEDVADDLVDGIIALLYQCIVNNGQSPLELDLFFFVH